MVSLGESSPVRLEVLLARVAAVFVWFAGGGIFNGSGSSRLLFAFVGSTD